MTPSVSKKHLKLRGGIWWFRRRVPEAYRRFDTRDVIERSLKTSSEETAKLRRDLIVKEEELYWENLSAVHLAEGGDPQQMIAAATRRYEAAVATAMRAGFTYIPVQQLVASAPLEEVVDRVIAVADASPPSKPLNARETEAIMGGASEPLVRVSDALEVYFDDIAVDDLLYKSEHQRYSWKKVKKTSIAYFIDRMGDLVMTEITREDAIKYQKWWAKKMAPPKGSKQKAVTANTVNRHIGNMRTLYTRYFKHIGQEDRLNPFRNMFFKQKTKTVVPPFSTAWLRDEILKPGVLTGIRPEMQLLTYLLVETGCRPSELINLQPEDIHLDVDVPYIAIRSRAAGKAKREVKTNQSERDIPLVGVSLEAAKRAPKAFPHYFDRNELFSANMMKNFRARSLLETEAHKIYSFRHSFEKRMQEANIDYQLRCALMGHNNKRPQYGDGGEIAYRRDELIKIVLPFSDEIFSIFDDEHGQWWT
ncbi:MAG: site-specific integrase [Pseudomonadota bacterium]